MRIWFVIPLSWVFCMFASPGVAQSARDLVQSLHQSSGASAAGVALWRDGAAEIAVIGTTTRNGADVSGVAAWHLGSNAKSMTALLVARLVAGGQIDWQDRVADILGARIAGINPELAEARYVDLLAHRSGLAANASGPVLRRLSGAGSDVVADRLAYATAVLTAEPAQNPGTFAYSNAGYVVVGAMLEAATGIAWEDLITRHVFEPLELGSAGFGAPEGPGVPQGHRTRMLGLGLVAVPPGPGADNIAAMGPAGRVHMALDDYLDYLIVTATRSADFLAPEIWTMLHTPPDAAAPYALGWAVGGDGALSHDGSNTLWYLRAVVLPDQAAAFVVNRGNAVAAMNAAEAAFLER